MQACYNVYLQFPNKETIFDHSELGNPHDNSLKEIINSQPRPVRD